MTYLIKRDDALAVILDNSKWPKYNAIEDIPAIDVAPIREDALREAAEKCKTCQCRDEILALIGEKK
jgi:hypothetical protein